MSFIKRKRLKQAITEIIKTVAQDKLAFLPQGEWKCSSTAVDVLLPLANDYAKLLMTRAVEFSRGGGTVDGAKKKSAPKRKRVRVTHADLEIAFEAIQMENTTF